jgi:hypothetical protein
MWTTNNPHFDKQIGVNMKDIPAFPAIHYDLADNEHGLTMRDYFAGTPHNVDIEPTELATWCYIMADRMLKARGK